MLLMAKRKKAVQAAEPNESSTPKKRKVKNKKLKHEVEAESSPQNKQLRQRLLKLTKKLKVADEATKVKLQKRLFKLMASIEDNTDNDPESPPAAPATPAVQHSGPRASSASSSMSWPAAAARKAGTALVGKAAVLVESQEEKARRLARRQRFESSEGADESPQAKERLLDAMQRGEFGRSEALEKTYLRLTSLPAAGSVRPPHVLEQAVALVKSRWLEAPDYAYACNQLKAIRQDLTVQHIRGMLAVSVYELHGRIALEMGDMAEFKQCYTVLKQLYQEQAGGTPAEFQSYALLHALSCGSMLLAQEMRALPGTGLADHEYVRHALRVCAAYRAADLQLFLHLYLSAPRMSPYLMDQLLTSLRRAALRMAAAAYCPLPLELPAAALLLGYDEEEELREFLVDQGAVLDLSGAAIDTRATRTALKSAAAAAVCGPSPPSPPS